MAYTIKNTDGTILVLLGDGKVDNNSTSISLIGKNFNSYGELWNNNLIKLMGHFANPVAPNSPIKGQIWYDSLQQKLNVYDNGWEPLNGAQIANLEPANLSNGDLWFDQSNDQLYIKTDAGTKLIGPAFSSQIGTNGWVLPSIPVQDNASGVSGNVKQVTLLRNYGTTLGYVANEQFTIATTSTYSYLTNFTTATVKGLSVLGDVRATENMYASTLTVTSNIVYPESQRVSRVEDLDFYVEINNLAVRVLNTGPTFQPEIRAISGSAVITFAGYVQRVGLASADIYQSLTTITTTPLPILGDGSATNRNVDEFVNPGDMMEILLTDQTVNTEVGIKTYRISIQVASITPSVKVSICIEKLV